MSVITEIANKILAKDAEAKSAIESDRVAIIDSNEAWNVATVAAANAHISAINVTRAEDAAQESEICALAKVRLSDKIDDIVDNELVPVDSIGETDRELAEHMAAFNEALAVSVASLQSTRDDFSTNVGDTASFSLSVIEAYDVTGIE